LRDKRNSRSAAGVQHVPAIAIIAIAIKLLVAGHAPDIRRHAVFFLENLLRLEHFVHDGAAAEELGAQLGVFLGRGTEAVEAFQDALANILPLGHRGHCQRLVGDGQGVEDGFLVHIHALDAVLNNDADLVGERWIIREQVGNGQSEKVTVTVLMLQSLAGKSGADGGAANQEAASAHIGSGPDKVSDSLKAEHRVINKKRDRVDPVIGISGSGGDKGANRTGFGDAFLKNLTVFGFLVIKKRVHVDRLVELAHAGVNSHLAEESLHAESAG